MRRLYLLAVRSVVPFSVDRRSNAVLIPDAVSIFAHAKERSPWKIVINTRSAPGGRFVLCGGNGLLYVGTKGRPLFDKSPTALLNERGYRWHEIGAYLFLMTRCKSESDTKNILWRGRAVELSRAQTLITMNELARAAEPYGWDRFAAKRFLARLAADGLIGLQTCRGRSSGGALITMIELENVPEIKAQRDARLLILERDKNRVKSSANKASAGVGCSLPLILLPIIDAPKTPIKRLKNDVIHSDRAHLNAHVDLNTKIKNIDCAQNVDNSDAMVKRSAYRPSNGTANAAQSAGAFAPSERTATPPSIFRGIPEFKPKTLQEQQTKIETMRRELLLSEIEIAKREREN